jgi:hypothetical protein
MYFNNLINELMKKRLIIIIIQTNMKNVSFKIIVILQIDIKNSSSIIIFQTDMKNINRFSIVRRYEHAFLLWKILNQYQSLIVEFLNENFCYLIELSYVVYIVASIIFQHDDYIKYSIDSSMTSSIKLLSISSNFVIIVRCTKNSSIDSFFQ